MGRVYFRAVAHQSCIEFVRNSLGAQDVSGRSLIEVGAANINGSARDYLESLRPAQYVGVDIETGPGVDVICDAQKLVSRFGPETFDIVVSTEMLEHVMDWRSAINNLKSILRPGGVAVLTTRSIGFPLHAHPFDFWRFEQADMEDIFRDFEEIEVKKDPDPERPGVFVKVIKPLNKYRDPVDLSTIRLYSIIWHRKVGKISPFGFRSVQFAWSAWRKANFLLPVSVRRRIARSAGAAWALDPESTRPRAR